MLTSYVSLAQVSDIMVHLTEVVVKAEKVLTIAMLTSYVSLAQQSDIMVHITEVEAEMTEEEVTRLQTECQ